MRIVSQDKMTDVNYDESIITIRDTSKVIAETYDTLQDLGVYKTEERAKEVMADIREHFAHGYNYRKENLVPFPCYVYEMPEK